MNGKQFSFNPTSHPSTLPFKSFINIPFSPLLEQQLLVGSLEEARRDGPRRGGQKAAHATHILPVEAYEVFLCECGSQSYAGNVSLCSARTRPEKPTTLFKEMAVRGPLANSPPLCFCLLRSKRPFLPCLQRMIIIFLCGRIDLFPYLLRGGGGGGTHVRATAHNRSERLRSSTTS